MKTASIVSAAACLAGSAFASPIQKRADIDTTVLNFALTLEHLENTYYNDALKKFSAADFTAAGAPASFYKNLQYVALDEATHVKELTDALTAAKATPAQACTYNFPYSDAKGFLSLSSIIEGVGTSAYLGAAPLITNPAYLTAAGSILVVEALHTSLLRSTVGEIPNANPNGTPLDPTDVYTIVTPFFKSCPASNPALPFKAFPALTAPGTAVNAGQSIPLSAKTAIPSGAFATFVSGLAVTSVPLTKAADGSYTAAVPSTASGQSYVIITKSDSKGKVNDADTVAGPAIIEVNPAAPSSA